MPEMPLWGVFTVALIVAAVFALLTNFRMPANFEKNEEERLRVARRRMQDLDDMMEEAKEKEKD